MNHKLCVFLHRGDGEDDDEDHQDDEDNEDDDEYRKGTSLCKLTLKKIQSPVIFRESPALITDPKLNWESTFTERTLQSMGIQISKSPKVS